MSPTGSIIRSLIGIEDRCFLSRGKFGGWSFLAIAFRSTNTYYSKVEKMPKGSDLFFRRFSLKNLVEDLLS
jgi:hypothetical protein